MIEVIKHGNAVYKVISKPAVCPRCKCEFRYQKMDERLDTVFLPVGLEDIYHSKNVVKCPECPEYIRVPMWKDEYHKRKLENYRYEAYTGSDE